MIGVLIAFITLVCACACAEYLRRARWIDRVALLAIIALGVGTRPTLADHRIAVANAIASQRGSSGVLRGSSDRAALAANVTTRLGYRDLLILSFTTLDGDVAGVGAFGRVFVPGR